MLYITRLEADKQQPIDSLLTHFSIGWIWGTDENNQEITVTWNGELKPIVQHFMDIFHSLDVQVFS